MAPLCVNCSMAFRPNFKTILVSGLGEELKLLLEEWAERRLTDDEFLCNECLSALIKSFDNEDRTRRLGHLDVCHGCGKSLGSFTKRWSIAFPQDHPAAQIALSWHPPRKLETVKLCRACHMRIDSLLKKGNKKTNKRAPRVFPKAAKIEKMCLREKKHNNVRETIDKSDQSETENKNEEKDDEMYDPGVITDAIARETITLSKYKRVVRGVKRCLVSECKNKKNKGIPWFVKEMFLIDFNIYIPRKVQICSKHWESSDWKSVAKQLNVTEEFSKTQIESMCDTLKRRHDSVFDFEFVEIMSNRLCKFMTGLTVEEFLELHDSIKWDDENNSKLALGILLIKLKREQNNEEIQELLGLNRRSMQKELERAIRCVRATDKTFFGNVDEESLSTKMNASFLSVYRE